MKSTVTSTPRPYEVKQIPKPPKRPGPRKRGGFRIKQNASAHNGGSDIFSNWRVILRYPGHETLESVARTAQI